ncbi:hypothetical protein GF361_03870 [Candidatus Woesearchaeota archaeon]|nr:hypothetical protein [Candidatus Woesearchaeota archaeon]
MKFISKKAQTKLTFIIIQLVLLSVIGSALFLHVNNVSSNTYYLRDFLAKDLSFTADTVLSPPGNLMYTYDLTWIDEEFDFLFQDQKTAVQEGEEDQKTTTTFPYADNNFFKTETELIETPSVINFLNSGYFLTIKESTTLELKKQKYPYINTKAEIQGQKIHLISGILKNPVTNKEYASGESFADSLKTLLNTPITTETKKLSSVDFPSENADMIILLNNNSKENTTFNIYIPSSLQTIKQSRKLASLIVNSIYDEDILPNTNILIIPLEPEFNLKTPSLYIEISNNILTQHSLEIKKQISNAIKEYYST